MTNFSSKKMKKNRRVVIKRQTTSYLLQKKMKMISVPLSTYGVVGELKAFFARNILKKTMCGSFSEDMPFNRRGYRNLYPQLQRLRFLLAESQLLQSNVFNFLKPV